MKRILLFGLISMVILGFLGAYHLMRFSDKNLHLIFCNVGQGDGIFIRTSEGIDIVIDGGPDEIKMSECLTRHMPLWDRTIEVMYLTHPDADHLTGLIEIVKSYSIGYFGTSKAPKDTEVYKELLKVLEEKKIPIQHVFRGDKMQTLDETTIVAHWPTQEFLQNRSDDTNDYSLVHVLSFGKFRALLTGDIPSIYLNSIMPIVGSLDVFKSPHHGSKTGVDAFTFQHNIPKLAVLSYGYRNTYHHPAPQVLEHLAQHKIPHTNTLKGDIEIISDGESWWIK